MKITSIKMSIEDGECVDIHLPSSNNISIGVFACGDIMICNEQEERIYHLRKTKWGGYKLKEGQLG